MSIDPPNVTSMIVDKKEVNGDYIVNEREEVSIICLVDKGNPKVSFQLLNKYGSELKSDINGGDLNYSLTARCEDEWPVVRCEGRNSIRNRTVSLLLRCEYSNNIFFWSSVAILLLLGNTLPFMNASTHAYSSSYF